MVIRQAWKQPADRLVVPRSSRRGETMTRAGAKIRTVYIRRKGKWIAIGYCTRTVIKFDDNVDRILDEVFEE
jgi:hypothetical protein